MPSNTRLDETDKPSMGMKFQMEELLLVRKCPFDPLVLGVHNLRVVGQALVVTDIFVERISVVSCAERREEVPVISEKHTSGRQSNTVA